MTVPAQRSVPADASGPTLVLLAAGLGTRFGGVKPLAPVGPDGEPLLDVALRQGVAAGFTRAVVVTGGATGEAVETAVHGLSVPMVVTCARQDGVGPRRSKPWGTVAATLAGARATGAGSVVLANGDDLYGTPGLTAAFAWAAGEPGMGADGADVALVAYRAARTLSASGGVSRAVPIVGADGRLSHLAEHRGVRRAEDGVIVSDGGARLADDDPVSMNLWVLRPSATRVLGEAFDEFIADHRGDGTAELGLPDAIGALLAAGRLSVELLVVDSPWHGVTWAADTEVVRAALRAERAG